MTKISLDPEQQEIEITRSIGKGGDGKITIDREGGGSIEIDLGFASIGVTSDYGGAISLGVAGQEVTWGQKGGTIHIGIGGFSVDVEARDCIVTEIKSIAGIIVAQRSYPDPGCKPEEPIRPKPPASDPAPGEDPDAVEVPDTDVQGWVFVHIKGEGHFVDGTFTSSLVRREILSPLKERLPGFVGRAPVKLSSQAERIAPAPSTTFEKVIIEKNGVRLFVHQVVIYDPVPTRNSAGFLEYKEIMRQDASSVYFTGDKSPLFFWGKFKNIKKFIALNKKDVGETKSLYPTSYNVMSYIPFACIPYSGEVEEPKGQPFLPTGNKPPMKDCCEEILDYLADFEEAFEIKKLLKEKFPVSNTFMAPECDPASVTRAKSYYEIVQCAFRMMAHGMIFEPRVAIKDADAAKAGDQEFKARYLNATGWASAMAEALLEVKDDGNVSTNMDIRNGFAATQTMVGVADAIYRLEVILDCLGIELIPRVETVETPYNVQIQIGKGFGEGNERQIDLNTDEATEKLLPSFLQVKRNKIKTVDIHPRSRSIKEILENIEANLPGATNG